jgi:hypothetical protein
VHRNYRRKNKYRAKHHGHLGWLGVYSLKPMKVEDSRKRRARERDCLTHYRFDDLVTRIPRDILWHYW